MLWQQLCIDGGEQRVCAEVGYSISAHQFQQGVQMASMQYISKDTGPNELMNTADSVLSECFT
mgnify:CR=1 FL=1